MSNGNDFSIKNIPRKVIEMREMVKSEMLQGKSYITNKRILQKLGV